MDRLTHWEVAQTLADLLHQEEKTDNQQAIGREVLAIIHCSRRVLAAAQLHHAGLGRDIVPPEGEGLDLTTI